MRIISGIYKNRRIHFNHLNIRPTTDRAKESLFNILENMCDLKNLEVLDLFSGSGNITYEFCSRGSMVTCVEKNRKCKDTIKNSVDNTICALTQKYSRHSAEKNNNYKMIKKIYQERKKIYKLANHKMKCDKMNKSELAKKIILLYEK